MRKKKELLEKRAALLTDEKAQLDRLTKDELPLIGEELAAYEARAAQISALGEEVAGYEALEAKAKANVGRAPAQAHDNHEDEPFRSFGENLQAIVLASRPNGHVDPRLRANLAASGGSATVDSDGGYLIQKDFSTQIEKRMYSSGALLSRCKTVEVGEGKDGVVIPAIDETSRATGSRMGGVQIYRAAETDSVTAQKPKLRQIRMDLEDLKGLAYLSNRLIEDASVMDGVYRDAFADEFAFVLDNEILRGTGAGQCLGVLNATATVSVAKETGQAASTIVYNNLVKMRARRWARGNYVWLYNQDIEPQLATMSMPVGTGGVPVYLPATGASGTPYDTLFGRPMIPIEQASTLGTVGDIVLVDLSQYLVIRKGGLRSDMSIHVRFINDELTIRFGMRVNGQPIWNSALTPANGSNTQSPFVSLATRS